MFNMKDICSIKHKITRRVILAFSLSLIKRRFLCSVKAKVGKGGKNVQVFIMD